MKREEQLFLSALRAALVNQTVDWDTSVTAEDLAAVLNLAEAHRVLPMVYQAVHGFAGATPEILGVYRRRTMHLVMLQTRRTADFLRLLQALREAGAAPLVVKGIVCRNLYPHPDHRLSSDEDVLIPREQTSICHEVLSRFGFATPDPASENYELPYRNQESPLFLELHRSLFAPESDAYGDMNRFFTENRSRAVEMDGIPTLCPTDHMLYLICHAFKHFLHSGFGIRQVCDMVLYANRYGREIDWQSILESCRQFRGEHFAAGLLGIGRDHLGFSPEDACWPREWQQISVDPQPLLTDILQAGVYGSSDRSRLHSSTITLNAVTAQRKGSRPKGLVKTIFPPAKAMETRYPYLKEKPLLLPVAWADRLLKYSRESGSPDNCPTESIRVGKARIRLLQTYGILDK